MNTPSAARAFGVPITPKGVRVRDCTVPTVSLDGWTSNGSVRNRIYAPHGQPKSFCSTTTPPPTTAPPTTAPPATEASSNWPVQHASCRSALPSEQQCATGVRRMTENRPENATYNAAKGTSPNDEFPA